MLSESAEALFMSLCHCDVQNYICSEKLSRLNILSKIGLKTDNVVGMRCCCCSENNFLRVIDPESLNVRFVFHLLKSEFQIKCLVFYHGVHKFVIFLS